MLGGHSHAHPHSHSHGHSHDPAALRAVTAPRAARLVTLAVLVAVALATVAGLVALWPNGDAVDQMVDRASVFAGGTQTVRGEVMRVTEGCATGEAAPGTPTAASADSCVTARVGLLSGPDEGTLVEVTVQGALATAGISQGDRVELIATTQSLQAVPDEQAPQVSETPQTQQPTHYAIAGVDRTLPLVLLALLFAVVVVAVGRWRGLFALVALAVSAAVLGFFVLPGLVAGGPGLAIGMVGSTAIMFITLFFVHGLNMRTASALIGTLFGIGFVSLISLVSVSTTRLSGIGDEASGMLAGLASEIDFRGVLSASILIAGLGVLNDITISQSSSVWELRSAAPTMSRREIYRRAMRIGRDHIASTVYTVVFAYAGAALGTLLLLFLIDAPLVSLLTREDIAIEVVRTLCGSVGLVLAVPVTTAVAAWFVPARVDHPSRSAAVTARVTDHATDHATNASPGS